MKGDILHITLKPEDFDFRVKTKAGNESEYVGYSKNGCPLQKAMTRTGYTVRSVGPHTATLKNGMKYDIKDYFLEPDFIYVKEQYRKDPEMKKCEYYVTLIEQ